MEDLSRYRDLGFRLIPTDGKQPAPGFTVRGPYRWKPRAGQGVALVLGSYVVIDVDGRNGGFKSLLGLPKLPRTWFSVTPSGGQHWYFRAPAADRPSKPWPGIDCLTGYRYCLEAPSAGYRWIVAPWDAPIAELPRWVPERAPLPALDDTPSGADMYDRAAAYIQAYPPAVSGQGGHNRTFVLAMRLARYFMLGDRDAMQLLERWNKDCRPPWSEKELRHKLDSARRNGTMRRV